ncbi:MAG: transcriptional regulator [Ferruginibacter sp.]
MLYKLDTILHAQLRLAIMSILMRAEEANFRFIKEKTKATSGNLSIQINKLKDAGYIEVIKIFSDNYPQTNCKITHKGREAFHEYVNALQSYIHPDKK